MRIDVYYFDDDRFKRDWDRHIKDPIRFNSSNKKWVGTMSPLDHSWNNYFSIRSIETSKFEEFKITTNRSDSYFIRIDNNEYLFNDRTKTKRFLYLWSEIKRGCDFVNNYRALKGSRLHGVNNKIEWFSDDIVKLINRDRNLHLLI